MNGPFAVIHTGNALEGVCDRAPLQAQANSLRPVAIEWHIETRLGTADIRATYTSKRVLAQAASSAGEKRLALEIGENGYDNVLG